LLGFIRVRLEDHAANFRRGCGAPATRRPDPLVDVTRRRLPGRPPGGSDFLPDLRGLLARDVPLVFGFAFFVALGCPV
jgi:hypothetical protein